MNGFETKLLLLISFTDVNYLLRKAKSDQKHSQWSLIYNNEESYPRLQSTNMAFETAALC